MNNQGIIALGVLFVTGMFLTIITRLYSNAILNTKYVNTNQGDPINLLPWSNSIYSVIAFLAIGISIVWAFVITSWLGVVLFLTYLLSNLITSKLNSLRKIFRIGEQKKCNSCNKFYDYSYYSINEKNGEGLNDNCVACTMPEKWKIVQEIKNQ